MFKIIYRNDMDYTLVVFEGTVDECIDILPKIKKDYISDPCEDSVDIVYIKGTKVWYLYNNGEEVNEEWEF